MTMDDLCSPVRELADRPGAICCSGVETEIMIIGQHSRSLRPYL